MLILESFGVIRYGTSQGGPPEGKPWHVLEIHLHCTVKHIGQCAVYGVQEAVCSVLCSVFNVQCLLCSVQCVVCSVQCPVYGAHSSLCSMQCVVCMV